MAERVTNLRSRDGLRSLVIVLPALSVVLLLSGVTARPALEMRAASEAHASAEAELREFRTEHAKHAEYERAHQSERSKALLERVRDLWPAPTTPIEAHTLVRLTADEVGFELTSLAIGAERDLGLEGERDRILGRDVTLGGRGTLSDVVDLVEALRRNGHPCAVVQASLDRATATQTKFDVRAILEFFQAAPKLAPANETASEAGTER